jgi:hypothetical protein
MNNHSELYNTLKYTIDKFRYLKDAQILNGKYKNKTYKDMIKDFSYLEMYINKYKNTLDSETLIYLYSVLQILKQRMKGNNEFNQLII